MKLVNAISIDVEDYFQVSAFENIIKRNNWDSLEHRVQANMDNILGLLAEKDVKATFFVLGWIAERYPKIAHDILKEGHELASHGYDHKRVYNLSPDEFRQDITLAKDILEDLSGAHIKGYRAPSYSIGESNTWALEVLAQCGYEYSSSIYPIKHDHYGMPDAPRFMFRDQKTQLIEIPVTTAKFMNRAIPAGGGGFFRFYPYRFSSHLIRQVNRIDQQPVIFYFHPWEIDPAQPKQSGIPLKTRFRHYLNLDRMEGRLKMLMTDFKWGRIDEVLLSKSDIPTFELS